MENSTTFETGDRVRLRNTEFIGTIVEVEHTLTLGWALIDWDETSWCPAMQTAANLESLIHA